MRLKFLTSRELIETFNIFKVNFEKMCSVAGGNVIYWIHL